MNLFYLYDIHCGWCMVASPEISKFETALPVKYSLIRLNVQLFGEAYSTRIDAAFLEKVANVGFQIAPQKTGVRFSEKYLSLLQDPAFELDRRSLFVSDWVWTR